MENGAIVPINLSTLPSVYYDANTDVSVENNRKTAMDYLITNYGECIGLIRYSGSYCQYIIQKVGSSSWFVTEFYNDMTLRWDKGGSTWYKRDGGSGTTNITGITWTQRGNVVEVTLAGVNLTAGTNYTVTGLPKPISNSVLHTIMNQSGYYPIGYIQYDGRQNVWGTYIASQSSYNFCSFTYLTDE